MIWLRKNVEICKRIKKRMGLNMKNKKILLDTCVLIYIFEKNSFFSEKSREIIGDFKKNWNDFFISIISFIEFLSWFKKNGWN